MTKSSPILAAAIVLLTGCTSPQSVHPTAATGYPANTMTRRPVNTFSIVARDPATGQLGVAVQSHWFAVGPIVPWARAGVGAVATQSMVDPSYGSLGLQLMGAGKTANQALAGLIAADDGQALRQVAMIDASGNVATHTGDRCIAMAGHANDPELQVSCQANMMASDTVWPAMLDAYRKSFNKGDDLAERLLAALDAAQAQGGDIRGKQSAAMIIVSGDPTGIPWKDVVFDLRVDDNPEPLAELRRLVTLQRAYNHMNAGDAAVEENDFDKALAEYAAAERFAPHIVEIPFWQAVSLASIGRIDDALPIFASVFKREPVWAELIPRLVKSDLLPNDQAIIDRIMALAQASNEDSP